jgi:apolipoprotein N-acyltransferase
VDSILALRGLSTRGASRLLLALAAIFATLLAFILAAGCAVVFAALLASALGESQRSHEGGDGEGSDEMTKFHGIWMIWISVSTHAC